MKYMPPGRTAFWSKYEIEFSCWTKECPPSSMTVDMRGRTCTTGVGPAGSVDRAEDTVGVVLYLLFEIVS